MLVSFVTAMHEVINKETYKYIENLSILVRDSPSEQITTKLHTKIYIHRQNDLWMQTANNDFPDEGDPTPNK